MKKAGIRVDTRLRLMSLVAGCLIILLGMPQVIQAQGKQAFEGKIRLERVRIIDGGGQEAQTYYFTIKLPKIMMEYTEPGGRKTPEKKVKIIVDREEYTVINMVERGATKTAMLRKMDARRMETMFGGVNVREKRDERRIAKGANLEYQDSTREISGYSCKQMMITPINKNDKFQGEAWISDEVEFEYYDLFNMPGIAPPPKASRVYEPGLFLMESYIRDTTDFLIHKAFVEEVEIDSAAFEIPRGFRIIDLATMETGYTAPKDEN